nr:unnamed protein product [Callosobruchus analis]
MILSLSSEGEKEEEKEKEASDREDGRRSRSDDGRRSRSEVDETEQRPAIEDVRKLTGFSYDLTVDILRNLLMGSAKILLYNFS